MKRYEVYPDIPLETIILIGSGAVENSWDPIKQALKGSYYKVPDGVENLAFASIVNQLRHNANMAHRWRLGEYGLSKSVRKKLGSHLIYYEELIKLIVEELTKATERGKLIPRSYLKNLKSQMKSDYCVITTNWDFILEDLLNDVYISHIHGDISNHDSLYLPSEIAWEPYRKLETVTTYVGRKPSKWEFWRWSRFTRPKQHSLITGANWLVTNTKRLIVTGLSFSALDAELAELIKSIVNPNKFISELIIIDIDPKTVLNRIRFHARDRIAKVVLLTPDDEFTF